MKINFNPILRTFRTWNLLSCTPLWPSHCRSPSTCLLPSPPSLSMTGIHSSPSNCPSSACRSPSTCLLLSLSMIGIFSTAVLYLYRPRQASFSLITSLSIPSVYDMYLQLSFDLHYPVYPLCLWQVSTAVLLPVPAPAGLLLPAHYLHHPLCL